MFMWRLVVLVSILAVILMVWLDGRRASADAISNATEPAMTAQPAPTATPSAASTSKAKRTGGDIDSDARSLAVLTLLLLGGGEAAPVIAAEK